MKCKYMNANILISEAISLNILYYIVFPIFYVCDYNMLQNTGTACILINTRMSLLVKSKD